jgi:hypothetical protein
MKIEIKIGSISDIYEILNELIKGVKNVYKSKERIPKEMIEALTSTSEMIVETLTSVKLHLASVISELRFGDKKSSIKLVGELGDNVVWEERYRKFQLCDELRNSALKLENSGIYKKILLKLALKKQGTIQQLMWDYIAGEANAASTVSEMLSALSSLSNDVENNSEQVIQQLELAKSEVNLWRQKFIELEIEIKNSIR